MSTFFVTNLNDSGVGSLRAAILAANADVSSAPNIIRFNVSGTIALTSDLPSVTVATSIDATTAPGYANGGPPVVELNFNGRAGLVFATGSNGSSLLGLAVGNANGHGVIVNSSNFTLNADYVGIHANGAAFGNALDGVYISATSSNNLIGINPTGASGLVANVISGNGGNGLSFHGSSGNVVVDNHIGTSANGNTAVANGLNGILITEGSSNNTIGGTLFTDTSTGQVNDPTGNKGTTAPVFVVPPLGNLVSGNLGNGIRIDSQSQNNVLNGNFVGTTANGNGALGNGLDGVLILNANNNSLIGCQFVNNPFVYYNVLSGNGGNGLHITNSNNVLVQANFFGIGANNATIVANGQNGILVDGNSLDTQVGGVIPLGNVSAGNRANGIYVTGTASGFETFNTFGGLFAFQGAAPNGNDGILIDSVGGNNLIRTNVMSGNLNNGIEIAGDAWGVTVDPNIVGLDTVGLSKTVNTGIGIASMANGGHGVLIHGTAHDNVIGGYLQSVIPQNTFSGNTGYGIAITGAAYNNQVFNSGIGTSSELRGGFGNLAGGILLSSSGTNNLIGGFATDPLSPRANYIDSNLGNGVTLAAGVTGDQVIANIIGFDRFGVPSPNAGQAIAINGSYANYIVGNQTDAGMTTIGLPVQEVMEQIEALYVSYFGRAADPAGMNYWMSQTLGQMAAGASINQAVQNVSAAFAVSPENAPYSALATAPLNPADPQQVALAAGFIQKIYQNSFNRAADGGSEFYWLGQLFSGQSTFSAMVDNIEYGAQKSDQTTLNYKMSAGSYFTALTAGSTPAPSAMVAAVQNVTSNTTALLSEAASNQYAGKVQDQVDYATPFQTNIITGVRGDYHGRVVLTGSQLLGSGGNTVAMLYHGPLQDTTTGKIHTLFPQFAGETVTTSTFYGPNTSIFTPSIGVGNVVAVGSYQYSESSVANHGMIYRGPVSGGGSWTQIDVPSSLVGGATVFNTIPHSTMGDLVVGDYDLQGVPASANAFIYNMTTGSWTLFNAPFGGMNQLTTAYGIWQNGIGSSSYTIAGGSNAGAGINQAYLVNYNSITGDFSNLKYYAIDDRPGVLSHFDGITAVPGGFNLVALGVVDSAFASVKVNPDGSFSDAEWTGLHVPGSSLTTVNSVYQDIAMGIYAPQSGGAVATYTALVDQSRTDPGGGLIMPVGAANFEYGTSVATSIGSLVVGSEVRGNVLGGSIGNDIFVGTRNGGMSDTIYTGGGADEVFLLAGRGPSTRIELYAGNNTANPLPVTPGGVEPSVLGSIVNASDVPQLGWWGQATGQLGGPVSNVTTNLGFGTGTSADMTIVRNFAPTNFGDSIDLSLSAFSGLLRSATPGSAPTLGNAVFSNPLGPDGVVIVGSADVLVLSSIQTFSGAAAVADALIRGPTEINFGVAQTSAINHYVIAYQDTGGNTRIADLDIHNNGAFTGTSQVQTLAVSDMVQLVGVSLASLAEANIKFVI
jgi:hypothetical protein